MKVQIRENLKKWWILVLVATLALSLTSCGKKKSRLMSGEFPCSGDLGDFSVVTLPYGNNQFQVKVYIDYLETFTDLDFWLSDHESGIKWRDYIGTSGPNEGGAFTVILDNEKLSYQTIQITPSGQNGSDTSPTTFTDCELPIPGQNDGYY